MKNSLASRERQSTPSRQRCCSTHGCSRDCWEVLLWRDWDWDWRGRHWMCDTSQRDRKRKMEFCKSQLFFLNSLFFWGGNVLRKGEVELLLGVFFLFFSLPFLQALSLALLWLFRKSEWVEWFGKRCLGGPRIIDTQETTVKIDMLFGYQNMMCVASIYH
jgi:hypothetical protein